MSRPDPIDDIEQAFLAMLRRANDPRGNRHIYDLAGADIERAGAVLLARLEDLQPARLSDLAAAVGVEASTASRQLARLVEQGYVERTADPDDGRAVLHRLSPAGGDLRDRLHKAVRVWLEHALADFDPGDREAFATLLGRFVEKMANDPSRSL